MIVDFLTQDELNYINDSLSKNMGMSEVEYKNLQKKHPYVIIRDDTAIILSSMKLYGLHDSELNKFILNKFGNPDYDIDFFYELIYNVDDYTNPHRDKKSSVQTTLILLSDEFTGGKLLVDDVDMNLTKKGQYISFNGNRHIHAVTAVELGQRRVLVIMFNKKQNLL